MKQQLVLAVALLAATAFGGERSSGGRPWFPHSITFVFSEMYPQYWTAGEDPKFRADLQLIRDVVSKDVASAEIAEYRTDIIELENFGKFPHKKLKTFVACLRVRNSAELPRIKQAVTDHMTNQLNIVELSDCDWATIAKVYSLKDLPSPVQRFLTP